jgi:putative flavoprotein involved in K+ transport
MTSSAPDGFRERVRVVIVGGGQAGLAASFCLKKRGVEHIVLEKADRPGDAWRQRWDSFTLVTPNWAIRLPGGVHHHDDPDGFMPRDEIVSAFERYATDNNLPIEFNVCVAAVEPLDGRGYVVRTADRAYEAQNVVVATGLFQRAKMPPFAAEIPPDVLQLHSERYRNPASLPLGAVLVVGSGQSGCQIAEELLRAGRQVFLSVGSAGRAPRRYRGKDIFEWLELTRFLDRPPAALPSPQARFAANPHVSGAGGGHDLNLHQFARDGMTLLGHVRGATDGHLAVAPDLHGGLAKADEFEGKLLDMIDGYIERTGLTAPADQRPALRDGYDLPQRTAIGLKAEGIGTIIWAAGYEFDFGMVRLPVFDDAGFPVTERGVTVHPGLYFLGLPWLHTQKSGLLIGVGDDATYLADHIYTRRQ